jgi:hypothetical protein
MLAAVIYIDVLKSGEYYVSCTPSPTAEGEASVATRQPVASQEEMVELLRSRRIPEPEIRRALEELATKGSAEINERAL